MIIQHSNLDGGYLNLDGGRGMLNLNGGMRPPYNLSSLLPVTVPVTAKKYKVYNRKLQQWCLANQSLVGLAKITGMTQDFFLSIQFFDC